MSYRVILHCRLLVFPAAAAADILYPRVWTSAGDAAPGPLSPRCCGAEPRPCPLLAGARGALGACGTPGSAGRGHRGAAAAPGGAPGPPPPGTGSDRSPRTDSHSPTPVPPIPLRYHRSPPLLGLTHSHGTADLLRCSLLPGSTEPRWWQSCSGSVLLLWVT